MSTFGTMRGRIADEIRRSDLNTQIDRAIKSAIQLYEDEELYFVEDRAYTPSVANQEYYSLPTDFGTALYMTVAYNNDNRVMQRVTVEEMLELNAAGAQYGDPRVYVIFDTQFRVHPIPQNANYTLTLYYHKKYDVEDMSDGTANDWFVVAEQLIRAQAKYDLYMNVIRDTEQAQKQGVLVGQHMNMLRKKNYNRKASGTIRPWGY